MGPRVSLPSAVKLPATTIPGGIVSWIGSGQVSARRSERRTEADHPGPFSMRQSPGRSSGMSSSGSGKRPSPEISSPAESANHAR